MQEPDCHEIGRLVESIWEDDVLPALSAYTGVQCLSPSFDEEWSARGEIRRAVKETALWWTQRKVSGVQLEIVELGGRTPVLFGEIESTDPERTDITLVYGHLDKQPPLGEWREGLHPFVAVREGDRLYGRGTADDGYASYAVFAALEALEGTRASHGRVVVLIETSEESGSTDLDAYLDALATRIGIPSLVICLDSGCATYDRLWVTTSLRGVIVGALRVDVLNEGVHSGHAGGIVPSSFRIARRLLSRIEDDKSGTVIVSELVSEIPPHRQSEIAEVADELGAVAAGVFPLTDGLELSGSGIAERIENGTWRAALEITGAGGLPALSAAGNVLRPFTELKFSIRIPPNIDAKVATEAIIERLSSDPPANAKVSVTVDHPAQGWDATPLAPWLRSALFKASMTYFGKEPRSLGLGGSIPFMAELGHRYPHAQFLATGVLGPESNAHGPNEFLHIPTAKALTCSIALLLSLAPSDDETVLLP